MAIEVDTVAEIKNRIISDIESEFGGSLPLLSRNVLRVIATVEAGAIWLLYKLAQRISRSIFPATANSDDLDNIGQVYGLQRTLATSWTGLARMDLIVSENDFIAPQIGAIYTANTGSRYEITAVSAVMSDDNGEYVNINIRAQESGADTNRVIGEVLNALIAQSNLASEITITETLTTAVNAEDDNDFRDRIQERLRLRPQGGSFNDYINWALEVSGVTRAWVYPAGIGYVRVYFVRDGDDDRIPNETEIDEVADYINEANRKPVGATLQVRAPTEIGTIIYVTGYTPDINDTNDALKDALEGYLLGLQAGALPAALRIPDRDQEIRLARITEIILAYGTYTTTPVFRIQTDPPNTTNLTTYDLGEGQLANLFLLWINNAPVGFSGTTEDAMRYIQ